MIRLLLLAQKVIGEKCFNILQNYDSKEIELIGVVSNTNPHVWWKSNQIYQECLKKNIYFIANEQRNNDKIKNLIAEKSINTIISVQHPWIIPNDILELVNYNAFNMHNAKLPEYKGYNACNHSILNGEISHFSTVHCMSNQVDMGAIIYEEETIINKEDTAFSLYNKTIDTSQKMFIKLINALINKDTLPKKEIIGEGKFYPRSSINKLRRIININDEIEVDKKSRAFFFPPFEPAYYEISGKKIYILPNTFDYTYSLLDK